MKLSINYLSHALMRIVNVNVILPSPQFCDIFGDKAPNYAPAEKYPVVYMLHGFGNDSTTWFNYTQAEMFAEERAIALVAIGGENKKFADCGNDNFEVFLRRELPQMLCGNFPISQRPQDTFICGLSMGGFGAMMNYLKAPQLYGGVGCFSAAFFKYAELGPSCDIKALLAQNAAAKTQFAPMYIACGKRDFLLQDNLAMHELLLANGVEHTFVVEENFEHEWRFWNRQLERFLDWLPRSDAYKDVFKRL